MGRRIVLTERETAQLMRHAGAARCAALAIDFGTGGVALSETPEGRPVSAWALPLLAEWRGITFNDGAGI